MTRLELEKLLQVESNTVGWKATGDPEKIVKTWAAYANDYEEVGSGWIVCGAEEYKDPEAGTKSVLGGILRTVLEALRDRIFQLSRALGEPTDRTAVRVCCN